MEIHQSFLAYKNFRYLKIAILLSLAAIVLYSIYGAGGNVSTTWVGYLLGIVGAILIVFKLWYGIRKRQYDSTLGTAEDWLSAHVYLGLALIVIVTLHSGFKLGMNVATLAYALLLVVTVTGLYAAYAYRRYPALISQNRQGKTLETLLGDIAAVDRESRDAAASLGDEINRAVHRSCKETSVGGSVWRQISGNDPNCATLAAYKEVAGHIHGAQNEEMHSIRRLLALLGKKRQLLLHARKDVQYRALKDIWLYLHVPLSLALLGAVLTHIFSILFFW